MGMRLAKRVAVGVVAVVSAVTAMLLVNAWRIGRPLPSRGPALTDAVDENAVAQHLAGALKLATVSHEDPAQDDAAVRAQFGEYLRGTFPRVHATLARESVRGGFLYTWRGTDPSLAPVLFAAHLDVVPAQDGWTHAPFSGDIDGGFVWGRGALDDKGSLICILEAAESLLARDFRPARTLYFAFGADEEVGGADAAALAALLQSRGVRLEWALDEGMVVTEGIVREISAPVAPIGIGEKGYLSFELSVSGAGGHASMPPRDTSIGVLAAAIAHLKPFPPRLDGVARQQLRALAPYMPFSRRVALANLWLFAPVIARAFADRPAMNASMHTTLAPTILAAGDKDNVLPASARAIVNSRILPGETMQSVLAHVRTSIGDARVTVRPIERGAHDPPELSPYDERSEAGIGARGYRDIEAAIGRAFPDAVIVPALVLGATDGRHYRPLSGGVYRWAPFRLQEQDLARLHGRDERVKIADLPVAVRAYMELMRRAEK